MGFQLLNILAANNQNVLERNAFDSEGLSLALKMEDGANKSRLVQAMGDEIYTILTEQNVTLNFHHDGVTPGMQRIPTGAPRSRRLGGTEAGVLTAITPSHLLRLRHV